MAFIVSCTVFSIMYLNDQPASLWVHITYCSFLSMSLQLGVDHIIDCLLLSCLASMPFLLLMEEWKFNKLIKLINLTSPRFEPRTTMPWRPHLNYFLAQSRVIHLTKLRLPNEYDRNWWTWPKIDNDEL